MPGKKLLILTLVSLLGVTNMWGQTAPNHAAGDMNQMAPHNPNNTNPNYPENGSPSDHANDHEEMTIIDDNGSLKAVPKSSLRNTTNSNAAQSTNTANPKPSNSTIHNQTDKAAPNTNTGNSSMPTTQGTTQ